MDASLRHDRIRTAFTGGIDMNDIARTEGMTRSGVRKVLLKAGLVKRELSAANRPVVKIKPLPPVEPEVLRVPCFNCGASGSCKHRTMP